MDYGEADKSGAHKISEDVESRSAVNSLILDYYKKFGRKRDLEQYFSLSTAQSDIKDTASTFWRRMKTQTESSDSGEGKSESSQELCRISIKCSVPQPSSSQVTTTHNLAVLHPYLAKRLNKDDEPKSKTESESPPIITEDLASEQSGHSGDESVKSDDNHSQKSFDVLLDLSTNKQLSPSSSVTSQRKLEWDSLADVGYGNESDRKNSASSLSTLERLALKQQYSNNDTKQDNDIGPPTAHSTPLEEIDNESKGKKGLKRSTKFHKKDIDVVEVNVPHTSNTSPSQAINVNLTKHISFNVERGGGVTFENVRNDVSVSPEKNPIERETVQLSTVDKEIQTSLTKIKDKCDSSLKIPESTPLHIQRVPILISVNTLRKRNMRRKMRIVRRKLKCKKKSDVEKENVSQEKSVQLSEAESFEYMPGHIYNQNQMKTNQSRSSNTAGNKSSLESSGILTTDSSKDSKNSLTKDLEKGIELLKGALQQRYDDSHLRKKLVQDLVQRLLKSKYRDDESTTEFLSGLSFGSKKLGLSEGNHTTTSTSDANNTGEKPKMTRPKKSILRVDKFNANAIALTSQSAPNLPSATISEKPVTSNLIRTLLTSNTESDISSKEKTSSDNVFAKTSSEELYKKYLEALRREESYKKHLKDKEMFLKQKLASSDSVYKATARHNLQSNKRLKDLIKDLTRNNYDDGSGDASKLEGTSNSNLDIENSNAIRNQRSHSVFTLSSGHSDCQNKKPNLKKRLQNDIKDLSQAGPSKNEAHLCCSCPRHSPKPKKGVDDGSVQVNLKYDGSSIECQKRHEEFVKSSDSQKSNKSSPRNLTQLASENIKGDIKYLCLCCNRAAPSLENNDYLVYKCSRLTDRGIQPEETIPKMSTTVGIQCECTSPHRSNQSTSKIKYFEEIRRGSNSSDIEQTNRMTSKSSQTNIALKIICQKSSDKSITTSSSSSDFNKPNYFKKQGSIDTNINEKKNSSEATRCIQTEISINPKISDPSLTDINIINERDCVKLIDDKNKRTIDSNDMAVLNIDTENIDEKRFSNIEQTFSNIETQIRNMQHVENLSDNFAIPIQGTNMTVMVSIGAKNPKPVLQTKHDEVVTQSVGTDLPSFTDQVTPLLEECSKCVQSQNTNNNTMTVPGNIIEKSNTAEVLPPIKDPCDTKLCLANEPKYKHNTYPKNVPLSERKPLLRSNTDTGNLRYYCGVRTNNMNKQDNDTIKSVISQSETTKSTATDEMSKKSVCGCGSVNCTCGEQKCYSEPLAHPNTDTGNSLNSCSVQTDNIDKENTETHVDLAITQPHTTKNNTFTHEKSKISTCNCGSLGCSCEEQKCYSKKEEIISLDNDVTLSDDTARKDIGIQKNLSKDSLNGELILTDKSKKPDSGCSQPSECKGLCDKQCNSEVERQNLSKIKQKKIRVKKLSDNQIESNERKMSIESIKDSENSSSKDRILEMIKDITQRYSKRDIAKNEKKKCFREIMTVMNYLLDTEDSTDNDGLVESSGSATPDAPCNKPLEKTILKCDSPPKKKLVDKGVQMYLKKCKTNAKAESSDNPISTDVPTTSSDSATCRVLNRIRKECERFHQKRCKSLHSGGKKCDASSSTSMNCEKCKRVHHCSCRGHKCKGHKSKSSEKMQKKCVAYNLIIQTSDSVVSEEITMTKDKNLRPLQNIIVKVPSKRKVENVPFKEMSAKIEKGFQCCNPERGPRSNRSRSLPNEAEILNTDIFSRKAQCFTVRDYLERNRPDFVEKSSNRQDCLKFISQMRANERAAQRSVLSLHLHRQPELIPTSDELRYLAREIGVQIRRKKDAPKFISEREMKKHSEKIYKSLPEVVQKKEDIKKENIKKTNLLMASIFKKNLQKKTLRGAVNLSNYSTVIKI